MANGKKYVLIFFSLVCFFSGLTVTLTTGYFTDRTQQSITLQAASMDYTVTAETKGTAEFNNYGYPNGDIREIEFTITNNSDSDINTRLSINKEFLFDKASYEDDFIIYPSNVSNEDIYNEIRSASYSLDYDRNSELGYDADLGLISVSGGQTETFTIKLVNKTQVNKGNVIKLDIVANLYTGNASGGKGFEENLSDTMYYFLNDRDDTENTIIQGVQTINTTVEYSPIEYTLASPLLNLNNLGIVELNRISFVDTEGNLSNYGLTLSNGKIYGTPVDLPENYTIQFNYNTNADWVGHSSNTDGTYIGEINIVFEPMGIDIATASISGVSDQVYTGDALTVDAVLRHPDTNEIMTLGTDYIITYSSDHTNVGEVTVTFKGKGDFSGSTTRTFNITQRSLAQVNVSDPSDAIYDGSSWNSKVPTLTYNGKTLVKDTDYTLSYSENTTDVGAVSIVITGKGNFNGSNTSYFDINPCNMSNVSIASIASQTYTGDEITPLPVATYNGMTLVFDTDYTLSYATNTNVGTNIAYVYLTGKGNYTGTKSKTFTITARTISEASISDIPSYTYTGSEIKPLPTIMYGGNTLIKDTDYTLEYQDNTNVGNEATVVIKGKGNYGGSTTRTFRITKADSSVTYAPTATNPTYDGDAQNLVNAGTASGGTMYYRLEGGSWSTTVPSATTAGTYTVYYYVAGDSNHNDVAENSVSVRINKANVTFDSYPVALNPGYDGSSQYLISSGSVEGGTLFYRLGESGSWSLTRPSAANAGSYTVYYYASGDVNHNDTEPSSISCQIYNANAGVVTPPSANSLSYTGNAQTLISAGEVSNGTMYYKLESGIYSTLLPTATNANTYRVYYYVVGDENYNDTDEDYIDVTIDKVAASVASAPIALNPKYNENAQTLVGTGTASGGTMYYRLGTTGSFKTARPTATNVDTYTVYYYVSGDENHYDSNTYSLSAPILKGDQSAPTSVSALLSGTTATVNATGNGKTSLEYSNGGVSWQSSNTFSNLTYGTAYTFYARYSDSESYNVSGSTAANPVTPQKENATVTTAPTAKTGLTYSGSPQTLINAGSASGGTLYYKVGNGSYSTSLPTATDAGTYTVYYYVVGDSDHSNSGESSFDVTISQASTSVTLSSSSGSVTYNYTNTFTAKGSVAGSLSTSSANTSYVSITNNSSISSASANTAYTITYKGVAYRSTTTAVTVTLTPSNSNYASSSATIYITVNKDSAYVSSSPTAKSGLVFNGSYQTLINAGTASGGTMYYKVGSSGSWSQSLPTEYDAGTYTVYYYVSGDSNHNDSGTSSVSVTISQASTSVTLSSSSGSVTYNYTNTFTAKGSVAGTLSSSSANTSYVSITNNSSVSASANTNYTITYKGVAYRSTSTAVTVTLTPSNSNYASSSTTIYITVNRDNAYVSSAPTAKTGLVYNGSSKTLINAGTASGGTMYYKLGSSGSWSTSLPSATSAGTYTVYYYVSGDSNHNDSGSDSLSVTISKATPTVTLSSSSGSVTYNSTNTFTAKASVAGTLSTSSANTSYVSITNNSSVSASANTNYTITYKGVAYRSTTTTVTVSFTPNDTTNYNTASSTIAITVNKANASVTKAPTAKSGLVYNESAQTLINSGTASGGTMKYKVGSGSYSTSLPTATNADTYTVYYYVEGDSNHNDTSASNISVTINKAGTSWYEPPDGNALTYTGSAQTLCTAGITSQDGVTRYYRLGTSGSWSTSRPTATAVGNYTVYYYIKGNSNYADSSVESTSASIGKASQSAPTSLSASVSGNSVTLTASGSGKTSLQYSKDGSTWQTSNTFSSLTYGTTYTFYARYASNDNYNASSNKTTTATIEKQAATVSTKPTAKTLSYTGSAQSLVNAGTASGGTMYYKLSTSSSWSTSIPTATAVGSYTVNYYAKGDSSHTDSASGSVSVSIGLGSQSAPTSLSTSSQTSTSSSAMTVVLSASGSGKTSLQYSKDGGSTWQSSNTFTGLSHDTSYTFCARYASNSNYNASSNKTLTTTTKKYRAISANNCAINNINSSAGTIVVYNTYNTYTWQFSKDGTTWYNSNTTYNSKPAYQFTGLTKGTTYSMKMRFAETSTYAASLSRSSSIKCTQ